MSKADGQQNRSPCNESMMNQEGMNQAGLEASSSGGERLASSPPPFQWEDWYKSVGGAHD